jgi:hypothetical protein
MIEFNAARQFFHDLKEARAQYFVVGSLAYDGLRGEFTKHKDIDLYVFEDGIHHLLDDDALELYEAFPADRNIVLTGNGITAELMLLYEENQGFSVYGVHAKEEYPAQAFKNHQHSKIPGLDFRIASNEVLRGGYVSDKNLEFARTLEADLDILRRIRVTPKAA